MTAIENSQAAIRTKVSLLRQDTSDIKSMMTEIYQAFKGYSTPSSNVLQPTLAITVRQANVGGEYLWKGSQLWKDSHGLILAYLFDKLELAAVKLNLSFCLAEASGRCSDGWERMLVRVNLSGSWEGFVGACLGMLGTGGAFIMKGGGDLNHNTVSRPARAARGRRRLSDPPFVKHSTSVWEDGILTWGVIRGDLSSWGGMWGGSEEIASVMPLVIAVGRLSCFVGPAGPCVRDGVELTFGYDGCVLEELVVWALISYVLNAEMLCCVLVEAVVVGASLHLGYSWLLVMGWLRGSVDEVSRGGVVNLVPAGLGVMRDCVIVGVEDVRARRHDSVCGRIGRWGWWVWLDGRRGIDLGGCGALRLNYILTNTDGDDGWDVEIWDGGVCEFRLLGGGDHEWWVREEGGGEDGIDAMVQKKNRVRLSFVDVGEMCGMEVCGGGRCGRMGWVGYSGRRSAGYSGNSCDGLGMGGVGEWTGGIWGGKCGSGWVESLSHMYGWQQRDYVALRIGVRVGDSGVRIWWVGSGYRLKMEMTVDGLGTVEGGWGNVIRFAEPRRGDDTNPDKFCWMLLQYDRECEFVEEGDDRTGLGWGAGDMGISQGWMGKRECGWWVSVGVEWGA
ncbi:hypothetical protein Tco_0822652 [Tanacetum coccineum]|uniref:Uncharacterized protein n=1 Tax=Tanacetum coccineum TaxID=301880 RepID=A0ABQ5AJY2_9ASTR